MEWQVVVIFLLVYLGMVLGEFPRLKLDRTGIALLGAIALLAAGAVGPREAWGAVDVGTIGLLLGLMVVSAQFRLGGFYHAVARRVSIADLSPASLLGVQMAVTALLSALLVNDIVCLAMAPVLVEGCARRGLDPRPQLLGLACASNIGSAATLIGNPQNMLIGQALGMGFAPYLLLALPPVILGLAAGWGVIALLQRGRWRATAPLPLPERRGEGEALDRWQTGKGIAVLALAVGAFLLTPWPREVVALAAAGVLLLSRRMASRRMLGLVDWQLLVLFAGLFVVNHALAETGALARLGEAMAGRGWDVSSPAGLYLGAALLSNLVSNVPAVMLLLPFAHGPGDGALLALASTLAGNLLLVGSIANLIVAEQAARLGVRIGWREHARVGVPVTLVTLAIAGGWLALVG